MTSPSLANPRRTSLAGLLAGAALARCSGTTDAGCRNVAVRLVQTATGPRSLCRTCGDA